MENIDLIALILVGAFPCSAFLIAFVDWCINRRHRAYVKQQDELGTHPNTIGALGKKLQGFAYRFLGIQYLIVMMAVGCMVGSLLLSEHTITAMVAFSFGAATVLLSATLCTWVCGRYNLRVARLAHTNLPAAFRVAVSSGYFASCVTIPFGLLCILGVLYLYLKIEIFTYTAKMQYREAFAGFAFGSCFVGFVIKVHGSLFWKAAEVAAHLSTKTVHGVLTEDPSNPACLAHNVGKNYARTSGILGDMLDSMFGAICCCFILFGSLYSRADKIHIGMSFGYQVFPIIAVGFSVCVTSLMVIIVKWSYPVKNELSMMNTLRLMVSLSVFVAMAVMPALTTFCLPEDVSEPTPDYSTPKVYALIVMGMLASFLVSVVIDVYYTFWGKTEDTFDSLMSMHRTAFAQLSNSFFLAFAPIVLILVCLIVAKTNYYSYCLPMVAIGALCFLASVFTVSVFGSIVHSAGSVIEMARLDGEAKKNMQTLCGIANVGGAVSNSVTSMAAIFVAVAALDALWFVTGVEDTNLWSVYTYAGLVFGGAVPFLFVGFIFRGLACLATKLYKESVGGGRGEEGRPAVNAVKVVNKANFWCALLCATPLLLVSAAPMAVGSGFGRNGMFGYIIGVHVVCFFLRMAYQESPHIGSKKVQKGALSGEDFVLCNVTEGPYRDVVGPSLNFVIKLTTIAALMFAKKICKHCSNDVGEPVWAKIAKRCGDTLTTDGAQFVYVIEVGNKGGAGGKAAGGQVAGDAASPAAAAASGSSEAGGAGTGSAGTGSEGAQASQVSSSA